LSNSYYRGAHGIIVSYDVTDKDSFTNVKNWMDEITRYANDDVCVLIMGNKEDMKGSRKVIYEEGLELAKQYDVEFMEASAKTGYNVDKAFITIVQEVHKKLDKSEKKVKRENKDDATTLKLDSRNTTRCC